MAPFHWKGDESHAFAGARPGNDPVARLPGVRRGVGRRAPQRGPGRSSRRRRSSWPRASGAHTQHQAWNGRDKHCPTRQPAHGGQPDGAAGPPYEGALDDGRRPGCAVYRRGDAGHRPRGAEAAHGRSDDGHHAAAQGHRAGDSRVGVVQISSRRSFTCGRTPSLTSLSRWRRRSRHPAWCSPASTERVCYR